MERVIQAHTPQTQPDETQEQLATWDGPAARRDGRYRLLSLFAPAPDFDELAFLRGAFGRERFYWAEPAVHTGGLTLAGVGIAAEARVAPILDSEAQAAARPGHRFDEVDRLARRLFEGAVMASIDGAQTDGGWRDHPARPRLFGGFAFQDDFVPDNTWSMFSPAHFVLPHFQYVRAGGRAYMTINALAAAGEDYAEHLEGLREALLARLAEMPRRESRPLELAEINYPMSREMWAQIIGRATSAMQSRELEKVVLSRVCEVRSETPIDAAGTLDYLEERYSDCYRFLFEPVPNHAFFGATPELLVDKAAERVETMALAGSIGRGRSSAEDEVLGRQLFDSEKNRFEHQLVVNMIEENLAPAAAELAIPGQPTLLRLRNIQHLLTPITGKLHSPRTGILALVRALHPTPAMGGVPVARALAFLRAAEPVPRGWYAAPIGWLDAGNDGRFAVAIRSAVTQHARAWLYAGAGIVADSRPETEWDETGLKFRPMLGALGVPEAI